MRLFTDARTDSEQPTTMTWDGTPARASQIAAWSENLAGNARFQWRPDLGQEARTLVEYPPVVNAAGLVVSPGRSAEWVVTPVGSRINRVDAGNRDDETVLRVVPPPTAEEIFSDQRAA